jgi:pyruvate formate lyase activating enzyme
VHIKAVLSASVIEYPGHIADVIYVGACNFRCPFCYNVDLVLHPETMPDSEAGDVLRQLEARRGFVDGVVISGGEPTLQPDLLQFLREVEHLGLAAKLDTNGYRPDVLEECLNQQLVRYVSMDVKSSLEKYEAAAGTSLDPQHVRRSIDLLLHSDIDYEFRTTVVPTLVEVADVQAILQLIAGARRYYLQCFRPEMTVGWGADAPVGPPSREVMSTMAELAAGMVQAVGIRGLPQQGESRVHPC